MKISRIMTLLAWIYLAVLFVAGYFGIIGKLEHDMMRLLVIGGIGFMILSMVVEVAEKWRKQ